MAQDAEANKMNGTVIIVAGCIMYAIGYFFGLIAGMLEWSPLAVAPFHFGVGFVWAGFIGRQHQ